MAVQMTKSQLIEKISVETEVAKKDVKGVLETLATVGIVSPMVANTDPRARFMLVCRRFAVAAR